MRSHSLHISQIVEGNYFGAYTCRACIRTRANTGKYSWGIIYVLVSCQGVISIDIALYRESFSLAVAVVGVFQERKRHININLFGR